MTPILNIQNKCMRNNRTAGHNYERLCVNRLRENGYGDVVTSRSESRNMDNKGVDIFGASLPIHIQCKNSTKEVKYHKLLIEERLPDDKDTIIMHKKTAKHGTRFITEGEYVIMKYETFNKLTGL